MWTPNAQLAQHLECFHYGIDQQDQNTHDKDSTVEKATTSASGLAIGAASDATMSAASNHTDEKNQSISQTNAHLLVLQVVVLLIAAIICHCYEWGKEWVDLMNPGMILACGVCLGQAPNLLYPWICHHNTKPEKTLVKNDGDKDDNHAAFLLVQQTMQKSCCDINALLGSIGASPIIFARDDNEDPALRLLRAHTWVHSSSPSFNSFLSSLLSMVKAQVECIQAIDQSFDSIRLATALRWGRTVVRPPKSPLSTSSSLLFASWRQGPLERLEGAMLARQQSIQPTMFPWNRLRRILHHHLQRQMDTLHALAVMVTTKHGHQHEQEYEVNHQHRAKRQQELPTHDIIPLALLRRARGELTDLLSATTSQLMHWLETSTVVQNNNNSNDDNNHLYALLFRGIQDATHQAQQISAHVSSIAHTGDYDESHDRQDVSEEDAVFHRHLQAVEEAIHVLRVALQSLRQEQRQQRSENWKTCQRIHLRLGRHLEQFKQIFCIDLDPTRMGDSLAATSNEKRRREVSSGALTPMDKEEYIAVGNDETTDANIIDTCFQAINVLDRHDPTATLIFLGQGRKEPVSLNRRDRTTTDALTKQALSAPPLPIVSEEGILEELRRHLQQLPAAKEVQINLVTENNDNTADDLDIVPRTISNSTEADHEIGIPVVGISAATFVNELASALREQFDSHEDE